MKVESNFEFHVFVYSSKVCCCDAYDQCSSKAILTVAYQKNESFIILLKLHRSVLRIRFSRDSGLISAPGQHSLRRNVAAMASR